MSIFRSLFGEHRILCFAGGDAMQHVEAFEEPENEIDDQKRRLNALLQRDENSDRFEDIQDLYNEVTTDIPEETFKDVLGELHDNDLATDIDGLETFGGSRPFAKAEKYWNPEQGRFGWTREQGNEFLTGRFAPWSMRSVLHHDGRKLHAYSLFGPRVGPPQFPLVLAPLLVGPKGLYKSVPDMMRGLATFEKDLARASFRNRLSELGKQVYDRRVQEEDAGTLDEGETVTVSTETPVSTETGTTEKIDAEKMTEQQKADKKAELEAKLAPLKEKEAAQRTKVRGMSEGPELDAAREELQKLVDEVLKLDSALQALKGERASPK